MIVSWITVKPVIARILRNTKGVDSDLLNDIPDWIGEGIFKLKTHYQLQLRVGQYPINYHMVNMPCKIDSLAAVVYKGQRLMPGDTSGLMPSNVSANTDSPFMSVIRFPANVQDIEETDINNYPFYLSTVERLNDMPSSGNQFYRVNYNKIETSIESGDLTLWYWTVPVDAEGLPMVPDNEDYQTALYWYVRMMMIGAGFEDRVFSHDKCEAEWTMYSARAINQITYPTPDEKMRTIMNTTGLIPNTLDWQTFGNNNFEGTFND